MPSLPPRSGLVITAADEVRVGDQRLDRREAFEELEHRPRIEEVEQLARRRVAFLGQDLPLVQAGVAHVEDAVGVERSRWEMVERAGGRAASGRKSSSTMCGNGSAKQ